jgi:hypothetical protein
MPINQFTYRCPRDNQHAPYMEILVSIHATETYKDKKYLRAYLREARYQKVVITLPRTKNKEIIYRLMPLPEKDGLPYKSYSHL